MSDNDDNDFFFLISVIVILRSVQMRNRECGSF